MHSRLKENSILSKLLEKRVSDVHKTYIIVISEQNMYCTPMGFFHNSSLNKSKYIHKAHTKARNALANLYIKLIGFQFSIHSTKKDRKVS